MPMKQRMDLSREFVLHPWAGGVKLLRPSKALSPFCVTVDDLLAQPFNVFFYDTQNRFKCVNEAHASVFGFDSPDSFVEKDPFYFLEQGFAETCVTNNQAVMALCQTKIFEERGNFNRGENIRALSFKTPLFNEHSELVGVFGSAIVLEKQSLVDSLAVILNLRLFPMGEMLRLIPVSQFSQRENECAYYLVRGKTAREIAVALHLSPRTVEFHLQNIKMKVGATSKSELIEKLYAVWGPLE